MIYMQNPEKQRYYVLQVGQDLFGTWCLNKSFGSLVNHRGRSITQCYAGKKEAWYALTEIEYKKRQRGYIYSDMIYPEQFYLRPQNHDEIWAKSKKISTTVTTKEVPLYVALDQQSFNFSGT